MAHGSQAVTNPGREDEVFHLRAGQPGDEEHTASRRLDIPPLRGGGFDARRRLSEDRPPRFLGTIPERPEESPGAAREPPAEPGDLVTWRARSGRALGEPRGISHGPRRRLWLVCQVLFPSAP